MHPISDLLSIEILLNHQTFTNSGIVRHDSQNRIREYVLVHIPPLCTYGRQRFKCKTCGGVFVETKNTILYNRKLSEDQIILVCKLLVEKNGIRAIERITGIHRDTISDVIKALARHAREVTDFLINDVKLTRVQVDEMWSFIKKNKKTLTKEMTMQINMAIAGST